jgi:transposase
MAKFKPLNENQLVMLPISLQDQLVPGTLEHTISELVEKHIDLSVFDARYNNDETGATAIHPKILLKVTLLAYARGMISSRQIERACQENILFIALSYGYAPDHSTIASFISSLQSEIETLFCFSRSRNPNLAMMAKRSKAMSSTMNRSRCPPRTE